MTNYFIYHETLARSCERAMLAWANSWISDRLDRMSKQGDSPNYEYGGSCGSTKGAQQLTFMYGCAAIRQHVHFTGGIHMMNQISELDLQNLRHLIGGYDTSHAKMTEYASRAADPEVRQFFQKSAQSAMQSRQQLMQFLQ